MVSSHNTFDVLARPLRRFIWASPIPHQISATKDLVIKAFGVAQNGIQRVEVGMDIAEDELSQ